VHRSGEEVRIFTRSLDDITARLPEVAAVARSLPHDQLVLDGEVLSLRADGRPEAFQVVASRTMSSVDVAGPAQTGPLQVFFFDLLHVDGQDLLDVALAERLDHMRQLLPESVTVPRKVCATAAEAADTFADAVKRGYEGRQS
jgi:DNA ligase-1